MSTIAHYRKLKLSLQLIVGAIVIASLIYLTFWSYGGFYVRNSLNSPRAVFLIPALILAWLLSIVAAATIVIKVKLLMFEEGRAVWIDGHDLMFVRSWYVQVPCSVIVDVTPGKISTSTFTQTQAVVLRLRSGTEKKFPTSSLRESREEIISKIKIDINLSAALPTSASAQ